MVDDNDSFGSSFKNNCCGCCCEALPTISVVLDVQLDVCGPRNMLHGSSLVIAPLTMRFTTSEVAAD